MKNYKLKILPTLLLFLMALSFCLVSIAQEEFPARPEPPRLVNDFAGLLSSEQQSQLENKLVGFNLKTSTQIAIVTVKSLSGYEKADYAFKLSERWGIGQKGKNNGILILVKPKYDTEKGEVFVAVGYGLESVVPDAVARQTLINKEMLPAFKQNDYFTGLDRCADVLISLTSGEFTAEQYVKSNNKEGKGRKSESNGSFIVIVIVMIIIFILKRGSNGRSHGIGSTKGILGGLLLMNMLGGNRHHGSWSDFSGGSGFGGGSSGGGFGGFGGGSFGGGGAGGSW